MLVNSKAYPGARGKLNKSIKDSYCKYEIGDIVEVVKYYNDKVIFVKNITRPELINAQVLISEIDFEPITIESLTKDKDRLLAQAKEIEDKITWMYTNKRNDFSPLEYSIFKSLQVLKDPALSDSDKAKIITNIMFKNE